jgi:hypothetical protein
MAYSTSQHMKAAGCCLLPVYDVILQIGIARLTHQVKVQRVATATDHSTAQQERVLQPSAIATAVECHIDITKRHSLTKSRGQITFHWVAAIKRHIAAVYSAAGIKCCLGIPQEDLPGHIDAAAGMMGLSKRHSSSANQIAACCWSAQGTR